MYSKVKLLHQLVFTKKVQFGRWRKPEAVNFEDRDNVCQSVICQSWFSILNIFKNMRGRAGGAKERSESPAREPNIFKKSPVAEVLLQQECFQMQQMQG